MNSLSRRSRSLLPVFSLLPLASAHAVDIELPPVKIIDKFGVNMANGQVTHSLSTVSIGGAMGLSHSVSVHANEFNYLGYRGFNDKFHAQARNIELSTDTFYTPRNVLRVQDTADTADFAYYVGSTLQQSGFNLFSGYTYRPIGDERHSLVVNGNYLEWTKPDGTLVKFSRGSNPSAASTALMTDVIHPNGFTITVYSGGISVNTNTGFQLKRFYVSDNRPLDKPDNPNLVNAPPASSAGWAQSNPKYIRAINNAVEHCSTLTECVLTRTWPTVTFNWPAGMPRTMYLGTSSASIVDPLGGTTVYYFQAYDLAYSGSTVIPPYVPGREFSPRLVGVQPAASNQKRITYAFRNVFENFGTHDARLQSAGVVTEATDITLRAGYDMLSPYMGGDTINYASGPTGVSRVHRRSGVQGNPGALYYVTTEDGTLYYEATPRNFPTRFEKNSAPTEEYEYTRANLTKLVFNKGAAGESYIQAEYPATCTSATRKTCNQAVRIRDANGNYTSYTYHAPSGQVATITFPPNKHGMSAQTRYEYTELRARYYDGNGNWITGTPIWLTTAERSCVNSSASEGACPGGDEVVARFEYNHNNLLMTGMTVTDQKTNVTLRTCYQYDIYGNQIGKTEPRANLSSCP